jgi:hypothetical protein
VFVRAAAGTAWETGEDISPDSVYCVEEERVGARRAPFPLTTYSIRGRFGAVWLEVNYRHLS